MDKYEFNIKVEQIKKLVGKSDYETAMKIADTNRLETGAQHQPSVYGGHGIRKE